MHRTAHISQLMLNMRCRCGDLCRHASEGGCLIIVVNEGSLIAFGNSHLRASETLSGMNCLLIITVIRNEECRAGAMLIYLFDAPLTGGERVLSYVSPFSCSLSKSRSHKITTSPGSQMVWDTEFS